MKRLLRFRAVLAIIKINIIVYFMWMFYDTRFMIENFLVSWNSLLEGRYWTLVTSEFSHNNFLHIFVNMFAFYGFGTVLERTLGTKRFTLFYLLSAVVASLVHSYLSEALLLNPELPALGASGAVCGVILLFSLLYPKEKILLLGIIPLPAIFAALLFVGLDIWGLWSQVNGSSSLPIGHGAHLGGGLSGLIYYLYLRIKRVS
jgi:rhomboid-like protein